MQARPWLPILQRYQGLVGLLLLFMVALMLRAPFFTGENLSNVLGQLAVPGVLAIGMTFVILTGGIDLSVGSHLALLNCVIALALARGWPVAAVGATALALGAAIGGLLGALVGVTRLQPFVVTLAALVSLRGIAFVITGEGSVAGLGQSLEWLVAPWHGLPVSGWLLLAVALLSHGLLRGTVFGRRIFAVGGNEEASRLSGAPVVRVRIGAYAFNGLCVAIAALVYTARNRSGAPEAGVGYELDAIAAAVVGGASLLGGFGSALGAFVGALFIVCLNVLLILQGVNEHLGSVWKGAIILVAVYLQNLGRRM